MVKISNPIKKLRMSPEARAKLEERKIQMAEEQEFRKGVSTIKDLISPSAFEVQYQHLRLGDQYLKTYFVYDYPRYLFTEWLSPIINFDITIDIGMHILPIDSKKVLDKLKINVARMEAQYNEHQEKGLVRDPTLEAQYRDAEELRDNLAAGSEKLFQFSLYLTIYGKELAELDRVSKQLEQALGGELVLIKPAFLQMEQGFDSTAPFGSDEIQVSRNMTTSSLATAFPFVSSELTSNEGIFYGLNRHTNGLVLFDRFQLENPNMVIFAKAGAGKSYAVKLEVIRSLMLGTEVIVIDPENEYEALCEAAGGSYLKLSVSAKKRLNPFDLPKILDEDEVNALSSHISVLNGLMTLMIGKMTPKESNIMDRALAETYARKGITQDPSTHDYESPLMSDLQETLAALEGGQDMAEKLNKFTQGTFSGVFNEPTNIELDNPFVVFSIRDLEDQLRPIAMYIILNYLWQRIRTDIKRRILVIDEAWILMKFSDSAQFLYGIAKRCRKYYLGLTTITQDVDDFLSSDYGKAIVTNSSLTQLFRQHPAAVDQVAKTFNLTEAEKLLLLNSEVGEGLFFAGDSHVAIQVMASPNEDALVTTKPQEIEQKKKTQEEAEIE